MTNNEMNERDQFEKAISSLPFEYSIDRFPDGGDRGWTGQYRDIRVEVCWEMWQASAKIAEESLAEVRARALEDYAHVHGDAGNISKETVSDMLAKAARIRAED